MKKQIFIAFFASVLIWSSSVYAEEEISSQPNDTVMGIDNNSNGIRDDIDSFIEENYVDAQKKASIQMAKNLQKSLLADTTDKISLKEISKNNGRAINCIYSVFKGGKISKPPAKVIHELEALTVNTTIRKMAYEEYNRAVSGSVLSLPEGDTCE